MNTVYLSGTHNENKINKIH